MFAALMNATVGKRNILICGDNTLHAHKMMMKSLAQLSRLLANQINARFPDRDAASDVLSEFLGCALPPDIETVRLMTDEELEFVMAAAKLGVHFAIHKASYMATVKSALHGQMPTEEEWGGGYEHQSDE